MISRLIFESREATAKTCRTATISNGRSCHQQDIEQYQLVFPASERESGA